MRIQGRAALTPDPCPLSPDPCPLTTAPCPLPPAPCPLTRGQRLAGHQICWQDDQLVETYDNHQEACRPERKGSR
jgi:hypothetical protein